MSTYVSVEISPATTTSPVVIRVSQATRPPGSSARTASRTESEIWSATLSGCPSVTDSDVKRNSRAMRRGRLPISLDAEEAGELEAVAFLHRVEQQPAERREIVAPHLGDRRTSILGVRETPVEAGAQVEVEEAAGLVRHRGSLQRSRIDGVVAQLLRVRGHFLERGARARDDELALGDRRVDGRSTDHELRHRDGADLDVPDLAAPPELRQSRALVDQPSRLALVVDAHGEEEDRRTVRRRVQRKGALPPQQVENVVEPHPERRLDLRALLVEVRLEPAVGLDQVLEPRAD